MTFEKELAANCESEKAHPNLRTGFVNKPGDKGLSSPSQTKQNEHSKKQQQKNAMAIKCLWLNSTCIKALPTAPRIFYAGGWLRFTSSRS